MACGYSNTAGYDSAGIAVIDRDGTLQVAKKAGRIENLEKELARPSGERKDRHRAHPMGDPWSAQ